MRGDFGELGVKGVGEGVGRSKRRGVLWWQFKAQASGLVCCSRRRKHGEAEEQSGVPQLFVRGDDLHFTCTLCGRQMLGIVCAYVNGRRLRQARPHDCFVFDADSVVNLDNGDRARAGVRFKRILHYLSLAIGQRSFRLLSANRGPKFQNERSAVTQEGWLAR